MKHIEALPRSAAGKVLSVRRPRRDGPGGAIRARARATTVGPDDLHDPEAVWAAYITAAAVFQL